MYGHSIPLGNIYLGEFVIYTLQINRNTPIADFLFLHQFSNFHSLHFSSEDNVYLPIWQCKYKVWSGWEKVSLFDRAKKKFHLIAGCRSTSRFNPLPEFKFIWGHHTGAGQRLWAGVKCRCDTKQPWGNNRTPETPPGEGVCPRRGVKKSRSNNLRFTGLNKGWVVRTHVRTRGKCCYTLSILGF